MQNIYKSRIYIEDKLSYDVGIVEVLLHSSITLKNLFRKLRISETIPQKRFYGAINVHVIICYCNKANKIMVKFSG